MIKTMQELFRDIIISLEKIESDEKTDNESLPHSNVASVTKA